MYGIFLKEEYTIRREYSKDDEGKPKQCKLFNDPETCTKIIEASDWLINKSFWKNDENMKDHIKNSQSDMALGFKDCGLTFISSENCPSNSLPLLWYKNDDNYEAPFPRVLSRLGKK
jgi:hypothetical protein